MEQIYDHDASHDNSNLTISHNLAQSMVMDSIDSDGDFPEYGGVKSANGSDNEDEDEFFDAVEFSTLPSRRLSSRASLRFVISVNHLLIFLYIFMLL